MATYNRGDLIAKAIQSVIWQTYKDWELIVVDDASTDDTEQVVKSFADDRIKYHKLPENIYYTKVRNFGIEHSDGPLLAFRDDDGVWDPYFLEEMVKPHRNPEVKVTYCGRLSFRDVNLATTDIHNINQLPIAVDHPNVHWQGNDTLSDAVDVGDIMIKRNVFNNPKFTGFHEGLDQAGYCSDAMLVDKIMKYNRHGKIVLVPKKLHYYFFKHGGKTENMTITKIRYREEGKHENELETKWSF